MTQEIAREGTGLSRRLWLVRHGSTAWNEQQRFCGWSDIPLSAQGREQARWLAACLAHVKVGALYSSDLDRARETAAFLSEGRGLTVQSSNAWRELHFGDWEGLTYEQIVAQYPEQQGFFRDARIYSPPGGETLEHLRQRVLSAFKGLCEEAWCTEGEIVLVAHGGALRVLLSSVLGMELARQWQFALEPGSLSALDLWLEPGQTLPGGTLSLLNLHHALTSHIFPIQEEGTL